MTTILTKRVYDPVTPDDGFRVLVDRLWPRGVSKQKAAVDLWAKDATPTNQLRQAYHSGAISYDQFVADYLAQLDADPTFADFQGVINQHPVVTLVTSVADLPHSHVPVLLGRLGNGDAVPSE